MQNNKPLRPHLSLKIEDNMGQKVDAGAIWFKTGKYGFFMSGTFNNNVRLNNGQKFSVSVRHDELKNLLDNYLTQYPEPPKMENPNQGNNNYRQGNNQGNYNNNYQGGNQRGFKSVGQAVPNVSGGNYGGEDVEYDQYGNPIYNR